MENLISLTDEELAKRAIQDKECFGILAHRYESKLIAFVRSLTSLPKEDAEDILQESYIKIYLNLSDFDPALKFSSWAYRITRNAATDHIRRKHVRPQVNFSNLGNDVVETIAADTNLNVSLDHKLLGEHLQTALCGLDIKYQTVLQLYYLEQKSYTEISDILACPEATVGTLLSRAKQKIKKLLPQYDQRN